MKYFMYFSLTGNGDYLASLYQEAGYTPVKVELVKPVKKVGFFTILKYGGRAGFNKKEKLKPLEVEFKEDDEVVIGSPIWNDRLSTSITTILRQQEFNKENTLFVLYPAGNGTKKSLKQILKYGYTKEPIVISSPLKNQDKVKDLLGL